jgi:hypothetical protein
MRDEASAVMAGSVAPRRRDWAQGFHFGQAFDDAKDALDVAAARCVGEWLTAVFSNPDENDRPFGVSLVTPSEAERAAANSPKVCDVELFLTEEILPETRSVYFSLEDMVRIAVRSIAEETCEEDGARAAVDAVAGRLEEVAAYCRRLTIRFEGCQAMVSDGKTELRRF